MQRVFEYCKKHDVKYIRNLKLSKISPVGIGGVAQAVLFPSSETQLVSLLEFLAEENIERKIIGRMTNLLFSDREHETVIISTLNVNHYSISDGLVLAECGVMLPSLIRRLAPLGLGGLEALSGIPGTVGATVRGNGGAFGMEIGNALVYLKVYSQKLGDIYYLGSSDMKFGYRRSILSNTDDVILGCALAFSKKEPESVRSDILRFSDMRRKKQPIGAPSLGSTFKMCSGESTAKLLDMAGLKGYRIGGMQISEKHAGFFTNIGGARFSDYVLLIDHASETLFKSFGVRPELEIEIIN